MAKTNYWFKVYETPPEQTDIDGFLIHFGENADAAYGFIMRFREHLLKSGGEYRLDRTKSLSRPLYPSQQDFIDTVISVALEYGLLYEKGGMIRCIEIDETMARIDKNRKNRKKDDSQEPQFTEPKPREPNNDSSTTVQPSFNDRSTTDKEPFNDRSTVVSNEIKSKNKIEINTEDKNLPPKVGSSELEPVRQKEIKSNLKDEKKACLETMFFKGQEKLAENGEPKNYDFKKDRNNLPALITNIENFMKANEIETGFEDVAKAILQGFYLLHTSGDKFFSKQPFTPRGLNGVFDRVVQSAWEEHKKQKRMTPGGLKEELDEYERQMGY